MTDVTGAFRISVEAEPDGCVRLIVDRNTARATERCLAKHLAETAEQQAFINQLSFHLGMFLDRTEPQG